jgi:cell division protein FtsI/penicillin-binding protein 2
MSKRLVSRFRLTVIAVCILGAFGGVGARLVNLQVFQHEVLTKEVEGNRKRIVVSKSRRGNILDTNLNLLATSRSFIEVGLDPHVLDAQDQSKFDQLVAILGIPANKLQEAADRKTVTVSHGKSRFIRAVRWVELHDGVDDATYDRVLELGIKGVYGNRDYRRTYPGGDMAAHIVGFVNREGTAVIGTERSLEFYLKGQDGWYESERDGRRKELAHLRSRDIEAVNGLNAVLSLDIVVQHILETELKRIVSTFEPESVAIIVSDPTTGFIMGLANYPTFDPNHYGKADLAVHRNIAISNIFEPGSTFKIVAASGALEEGLVGIDTPFDCGRDSVMVGRRRLPLPQDSHRHGVLSVADIICKSSNRGAAQIGILLGPVRLHKYAQAFGFGQKTGFLLSGEENGILHPVRNWDDLTITRLPMGHAVGATPLQIHAAMSAIANGGILMKPQIVRRITDSVGDIVVGFEAVQRRRIISRSTARTMASLLQKVVSPEGTAPAAAIPGFEVAGKTGTTQKIIDGHYSHSHHVGSFTGFFPASRPTVAVTVIIDDARLNGTAYGTTVAAPSFKAIAEQLIPYLGVNPTEPVGKYAVMENTLRDRHP